MPPLSPRVTACMRLSLLLPCSKRLLGPLLLRALYHDHAEEASNNRDSDEDDDHGDPDSPYARREEVVQLDVFVHKWLRWGLAKETENEGRTGGAGEGGYHEQSPDRVV